ncbi:ion transporter [Oscillatoria sp. FACHB-1407]|uniref:ion transporter n=1 Tax=Oscillatoria sp. FACHB-1407 TaxID=2692847 RepID=UPI0016881C5B|nr:ion transporter [Oscillatoria sp. FACHB-1407]MBD2464970.1 ion transporter [Oscillatoria sp. FACHB-1407]
MSLKQQISFYLEDIETPLGRAINFVITGLVLLSCVIFITLTYPIPDSTRATLNALDNGILLIFIVEYLLRFWCAEDRAKYVFSLYSMIDLIAILPFFLGATTDIRFIRLFRWFRILRLIRFIEGRTIFGYVSSEDSVIVTRILFTIFAIVFVFSGLIYQVEHPSNPEGFKTFLDAIYFSVATMTTVGFGDVTPKSELGRFLTVLMILTGIALIPWQLGNLIKRLVKTTDQVEIPCSCCGLSVHDDDAHFCKACGAKLGSGERRVGNGEQEVGSGEQNSGLTT